MIDISAIIKGISDNRLEIILNTFTRMRQDCFTNEVDEIAMSIVGIVQTEINIRKSKVEESKS